MPHQNRGEATVVLWWVTLKSSACLPLCHHILILGLTLDSPCQPGVPTHHLPMEVTFPKSSSKFGDLFLLQQKMSERQKSIHFSVSSLLFLVTVSLALPSGTSIFLGFWLLASLVVYYSASASSPCHLTWLLTLCLMVFGPLVLFWLWISWHSQPFLSFLSPG